MSMQQGELTMNFTQPPDILSTKDLLYIEDMLSWNLNIIKKAHAFSSMCKDKDVTQAMNRTCQLHMRHYQAILNHLEKHVQAESGVQG
ncbi:hypothetical protein EWI07_00455 [Sporolactobacillus sp. THM7-4]|nr:hypothetical protein EWI07_00455 [Sporolactobacillus sp. THM7-4]